VAMMMQMPIVLVQRTKWVRERKLLNNVLFWCSMILGLSMVSKIRCKATRSKTDIDLDLRPLRSHIDVDKNRCLYDELAAAYSVAGS